MIRPLILADLDDTLFQSHSKCGDWFDDELTPMSWLADGHLSGFATPRQRALLHWLQRGEVVPVTARSRKVMARVNIAQAPAICANGGCVLTASGAADMVWHARLEARSRCGTGPAGIYADLTKGLLDEDYRHWVVSESGLDLYIVIKSNRGDEEGLLSLGRALTKRLPDGWRCHSNRNNLAFLPPWLSKRQAVAYLLEAVRAENPDRLVVAIGDSRSDAGFMDLADVAILPTDSQLWAEMTKGNEWVG